MFECIIGYYLRQSKVFEMKLHLWQLQAQKFVAAAAAVASEYLEKRTGSMGRLLKSLPPLLLSMAN